MESTGGVTPAQKLNGKKICEGAKVVSSSVKIRITDARNIYCSIAVFGMEIEQFSVLH